MRTGAAAWTGALKAKRRATCLKLAKKISLSICMRMTNNFFEISEEIDTETTSHRVVHSSAVRGGAASGPSALE